MWNPSSTLTYLAILFSMSFQPLKLEALVHIFPNNLKVSVKDNFGLYVQECEDLWFDVKFPEQNNNHIFAVIYRHPHNNLPQFLNALDE